MATNTQDQQVVGSAYGGAEDIKARHATQQRPNPAPVAEVAAIARLPRPAPALPARGVSSPESLPASRTGVVDSEIAAADAQGCGLQPYLGGRA